MAVDASTMAIISAVGSAGAGIGGAMWIYMKALHSTTVRELRDQNKRLERRSDECEDDRRELHGRLNDQSERITTISLSLGRLEGKLNQVSGK